MGTNWFMPALVNSRFGLSGMSEDEGTMVCCFDLKKSRNDWRISADVIRKTARSIGNKRSAKRVEVFAPRLSHEHRRPRAIGRVLPHPGPLRLGEGEPLDRTRRKRRVRALH